MKKVWVVQFWNAYNKKEIKMFKKEPTKLLQDELCIAYFVLEFEEDKAVITL